MNRALLDDVRAAVVADPTVDRSALIDRQIAAAQPLLAQIGRSELSAAILAELGGFGILTEWLHDPSVSEIMLNGDGAVWVERDGLLSRQGRVSPDTVAATVERLLAPLGLRADRTRPIVDARLSDGSRVCVVLPPASVDGTVVSIRRFRLRSATVEAFGPESVADLCRELTKRRLNVLVSGATSSGKTTLLNALATLAIGERLITIEDTAELSVLSGHVVRLEARPASPDGLGAVSVRDLVRAALRLRPDRLIVGEVRGDEAVDLIQALNTGHDGSLGTIHANSPTDALRRLETLVVRAVPAWPLPAVRAQIHSAIDVVIHTVRRPDGARSIAEIIELGDGPADPSCIRPLARLNLSGRSLEVIDQPARDRQ